MLEKEWDEDEERLQSSEPHEPSIQELAEEALKSEERIQRIITRENN